MQTALLSHTPVTEYMHMSLADYWLMQRALYNVLERQKANQPGEP